MIRNILFLLLPFLALLAPVLAQVALPGQLRIDRAPSYDVSRQLLILEDRSGQLTIEDAVSSAFEPDYRVFDQQGTAYNLGITESAYWFKLTMDVGSTAHPHWLLDVAHPAIDEIDIYVPRPGSGYVRLHSGDTRPFSERLVPHKNHVFPIQLLQGRTTTIYIRAASEGSLVMPVTLWQPSAFMMSARLEYAVLSTYFGVLLAMTLYTLMLYTAIRDRAYLMYAGFAVAMASTQAFLTGVAAELVVKDHAHWNNIGDNLSVALAACMGALFARAFLGMREHMPRLDKLTGFVTVVWAAIAVATPWLEVRLASEVTAVFIVLTALVGVMAGFLAFRQNRPGARYFLLAWGSLFVGIFVFALRELGVMPANFGTNNALLFGSAAEMLLLSFALADRINLLRRERFLEQEQLRLEHRQKEAAQRALAEKSSLLAAIGADMRQPMVALGVSIDGLERVRLAEPFGTMVPDMRSTLGSINGLLDSLLFMSRLDSGVVEAHVARTDVAVLMARVRATFDAQARRKGLRLRVVGCKATLWTDPLLLERIVSNLVGNALRYTANGGVLVGARRRAGGILFQVWDTGPGIPEDQQEAVFGEFYRLARDDREDGGLGLGLSIVRQCAGLLGCRVTLASRTGHGTCFSVFVPSMFPGGEPSRMREAPWRRKRVQIGVNPEDSLLRAPN